MYVYKYIHCIILIVLHAYVFIVTGKKIPASISGPNFALVNATVRFEVTADPLVFILLLLTSYIVILK